MCTIKSLSCAVLLFATIVSLCASQDLSSRDEYEVFPTGTYKLHTERRTWGDAWNICIGEGAHLAIINNDTEAFILSGLFARIPQLKISDNCILGFHDMFLEGKYVTVFGEPLADTGYLKWVPGEPNNANGNENCGAMSHSALLNDAKCDEQSVFICEKL